MAHSTMLHVRVDDEIKTQASVALAMSIGVLIGVLPEWVCDLVAVRAPVHRPPAIESPVVGVSVSSVDQR